MDRTDTAELLRIMECAHADAEAATDTRGDYLAAAESAEANIGVALDRTRQLVAEHAALLDAIADLADGDMDTCYDVGTRMTCDEVDRLARVLALAGHTSRAETWIIGHALPSESDEGDVDPDLSRHHAVWAAYDAEDDDGDGHEAAEAPAAEYVRTLLATNPA